MSDWVEFTAKTVDDAILEALKTLGVTSDKIEYEVIEKESSGFLGLFNKPGKIRAKVKYTVDGAAREFLGKVLNAMQLDAQPVVNYNEEEETLEIEITGNDMGVLIGKRGQTLDSLQYLTSLVVNKDSDKYLKVKLDTENYRERRKETLENLAKNIAVKVKRTKKPVTLEPMNPYERRIIHSALQNDKFVETHSEGEEPYRKVIVTLKKGVREYPSNGGAGGNSSKYGKYSSSYKKNTGGYRKDYRKPYDKPYDKTYDKPYDKNYSGRTGAEKEIDRKAPAEAPASTEE